jgi:hypothetical protein
MPRKNSRNLVYVKSKKLFLLLELFITINVNTKTYKLLIKTKSSINRIVKMPISQWEGEFKIEEKEICF